MRANPSLAHVAPPPSFRPTLTSGGNVLKLWCLSASHCPLKFSLSTNWSNNCFCFAGGEEWKLIAEKLGLNPQEIRYLDKRVVNPFDAALSYVAKRHGLTVGTLYDVLSDCGQPRLADDYL